MPASTPRDLPQPYPIQFQKDSGLYIFQTDQEILYTCGFGNVTSKLSPVLGIYDLEVFDFELFAYDETPEVRKPKDQRVSATVIDMIGSFFTTPLRVLLYLCDSSDGRSRERQLLFRKWHSNIADVIDREELTIEVGEDGIAYGSILTRKDFPHKDILDTELKDKASEIILEKFGR